MEEVFRYRQSEQPALLPLNERGGGGVAAIKIRSKETERMFGIRVETSPRIRVNSFEGTGNPGGVASSSASVPA